MNSPGDPAPPSGNEAAAEALLSERAPLMGASPAEVESPEVRIRRLSRRGFAIGGAAALAGFAGWRWLITRSQEGDLPWPIRRVLEFDERVAQAAFRPTRLSPEFPRASARMPRVNGMVGIAPSIDPAEWRLRVVGSAGARGARSLALDEIKALPRVEMTTELRCVEGWSEVVHWAGARLAELASVTGLATRGGQVPAAGTTTGELLEYVAMSTPNGQYYVGLDMASALHPQTLLCYEMDGHPLTLEHGAPLRLVIPVKYGFKSLKQIGTIAFTDLRPSDFWAERGYDWYAGH